MPSRPAVADSTSHSSAPVAIITGAGSGIGQCAALRLAELGYRLVLVGRRLERLEHTIELLPPGPAEACAVAADLSCGPAASQAVIAAAIERFGRIDTLVNNAGAAPRHPIPGHTAEEIEQTFQLNSVAPACLIALAWPHLAAGRAGCIINISSMASTDPFDGFFAYAATKAAVNMLAHVAAKEGREAGIRAFAIAPGAVETETLRALFPPSVVPRGQCLSPGDIADVIVDCITGKRDAQNGTTIFVSAAKGNS
ncbi:MAG: SDR family oxidoreductase [Phycisphaeraceae bacterium]|nr:SDR family oxidoreductase [Phycisphaeraceae bacterium]